MWSTTTTTEPITLPPTHVHGVITGADLGYLEWLGCNNNNSNINFGKYTSLDVQEVTK